MAAVFRENGTRAAGNLKPGRAGLFGACLVGLGVLVSASGGCQSSVLSPTEVAATGNPLTMTGDWDDLDAAVEVGLGQAEAVQVGKPVVSADGRERVYRFEHISGLKGELTATRLSEREQGADVRLACRAGAIATRETADIERRVLARVKLRLGDLLGKEFAPIRE